MKDLKQKSLLKQAKELQDFFLGTYADKAIQAAIDSGNEELLELAVKEYQNQVALIEAA